VLLLTFKSFDTFALLWQVAQIACKAPYLKGIHMPKEEWGVKRLCPTTGQRFYDLNKDPIVSPYTGEVVVLNLGKSRSIKADAEDAETKKMKEANTEDDAVLDDDDETDSDLGDDVLEDDDDDDEVSLDEIADVAADDDDS
jgi:uncharacterized protein (TIGR02300 family)